jgi:hypothetical protein
MPSEFWAELPQISNRSALELRGFHQSCVILTHSDQK